MPHPSTPWWACLNLSTLPTDLTCHLWLAPIRGSDRERENTVCIPLLYKVDHPSWTVSTQPSTHRISSFTGTIFSQHTPMTTHPKLVELVKVDSPVPLGEGGSGKNIYDTSTATNRCWYRYHSKGVGSVDERKWRGKEKRRCQGCAYMQPCSESTTAPRGLCSLNFKGWVIKAIVSLTDC